MAHKSSRLLNTSRHRYIGLGSDAAFPLPIAAAQRHSEFIRRSILTCVLVLCVVLSATPSLGAGHQRSPIERAIGFLVTHQVPQPLDVVVNRVRVIDFPGDWPQYFHLQGREAFRVRDVSPFMVTFVHHALTHIVEENRQALGVSWHDLQVVRLMRRRAVAFVKRFESPPGGPDAGSFAFWPYDADPTRPSVWLTNFLTRWLQSTN